MYQTHKFAGAVCYLQTYELRNTSMLRLRRVAGLCSSNVSDPANRLRKIRKKKSSAVPLFSQRSHVGNLRQTLQGKGVIHKRVETAGVYPLVPPPGRRTPRGGSAKNFPPVRGEHAYAVRVPRSAGAEKPPARFAFPRLPLYHESEKGTAHAVPLPSADMLAAQQQQLPQLPQPPQVLSPQVPQEPQPPLP